MGDILNGKRLRRLRKNFGLTQEQLASKMKVSTSTIRMIELEKRNGSINLISNLASFFNVTVDFLQGKESEIEENQLLEKDNVVDKLLNRLVNTGIVTNPNDVGKDIEDMIVFAAKTELEKKLKKKNDEQ